MFTQLIETKYKENNMKSKAEIQDLLNQNVNKYIINLRLNGRQSSNYKPCFVFFEPQNKSLLNLTFTLTDRDEAYELCKILNNDKSLMNYINKYLILI